MFKKKSLNTIFYIKLYKLFSQIQFQRIFLKTKIDLHVDLHPKYDYCGSIVHNIAIFSTTRRNYKIVHLK